MPAHRRAVAAALVAVAALLAGGCGAAHHAVKHRRAASTTAVVCLPGVPPAVGGVLDVSANQISAKRSEGSNGMPQCTFLTRAGGVRVSVIVNVDDGPQVEFRLARKVTEASQIFGTPPPGWQAPIGLYGLGPSASWFPMLNQLMATNGSDIMTVSISWPGAKRAAMIKLARAAVGPYMKEGRRPGPKAIVDYP